MPPRCPRWRPPASARPPCPCGCATCPPRPRSPRRCSPSLSLAESRTTYLPRASEGTLSAAQPRAWLGRSACGCVWEVGRGGCDHGAGVHADPAVQRLGEVLDGVDVPADRGGRRERERHMPGGLMGGTGAEAEARAERHPGEGEQPG